MDVLTFPAPAYTGERTVAESMSQPTPLKPRKRRELNWQLAPMDAAELRRWWTRQTALVLTLMLLALCYAGPLQQDATAVVARKKELPVYSVERDDNVVSVTFDASWGGSHTMQILDILDQYDAKATFYLVGLWVDKYPELVQAIHERGHEIGNHSNKHDHMPQLSADAMRKDLAALSDKVEALTGERPTLFRAPYGDYNDQVITVARAEGYEVVQWSIDSLDWKNRGVEDLIRRATTNVQKGDIILFHNDAQYIADALPAILAHYQSLGLKVVSTRDILLSGETTIDVQGKQHPMKAE